MCRYTFLLTSQNSTIELKLRVYLVSFKGETMSVDRAYRIAGVKINAGKTACMATRFLRPLTHHLWTLNMTLSAASTPSSIHRFSGHTAADPAYFGAKNAAAAAASTTTTRSISPPRCILQQITMSGTSEQKQRRKLRTCLNEGECIAPDNTSRTR